MASAVLLLSCPDRQGIVAAVATFVADHNGNVLHADQHVDPVGGVFFQRVEFDLDSFDLDRAEIWERFAPIAERFQMDAALHFSDDRVPVAVLASKQPHCLGDLLVRWHTGELPCDLRVVISNHRDHAGLCEPFDVPYVVHDPDEDPNGSILLDHLAGAEAELVVLARYMRILPPAVIAALPHRIINIHHSFLPAFVGARPYRQAYERGVKLIGATAHFATDELDEGPIIEQETVRVSHRHDVARMAAAGRDLETNVLARAVRAHLEHRILVYGHKTVVF